jgi:hypothetical protein
MTAHFLAEIVQSQYHKLNIDEMLSEFKGIEKYQYGRISDEWINKRIENKQYYKWQHAGYLLEMHIRENWDTFEQTELVYTWAKDLCEKKNRELNKKRMTW